MAGIIEGATVAGGQAPIEGGVMNASMSSLAPEAATAGLTGEEMAAAELQALGTGSSAGMGEAAAVGSTFTPTALTGAEMAAAEAEALGAGSTAGMAEAGFGGSILKTITDVGSKVANFLTSMTPGQAALVSGGLKLLGGIYMDKSQRDAYTEYLNRAEAAKKEDWAREDAVKQAELDRRKKNQTVTGIDLSGMVPGGARRRTGGILRGSVAIPAYDAFSYGRKG